MRVSTILFTLFATLAVAAPAPDLASVDEAALWARDGAPAGTCSKGGDKGESCSALKCQSNSKSGRGGGVS
ncbi:hypothetical protein CkaCkLH20_10530 [Colletotrichum karsti]|uniref:Uncharacterized protein n=1 Tax=Colletotrichum karsti TaxID=1095194 RepID=A0A9P6HV53_9PEZI|nr:uncharacterized protein CkaCkLH20_10530 [Colletotrichum karsti]KAF9871898.1 hypothetical protein CkaCkLH20_10530 [Colletotrichum karsti]